MRFAETHHQRCPIERFPELAADLYKLIGECGAPPPWSWTTFCEGAWRKIDGHIFLHQVLDSVDFRSDPSRVLLHAPTSIGELKEWFAVV